MQLVVGESVIISDSLSSYEALRALFEVADERGHAAPSVVVNEHGEPLTHPDYIDRMGASHAKAGAWAFCRQPAAEALGLPAGTDWVRERDPHLKFQAGSPYLAHPHLHDQVYIHRFGEDRPLPMAPVSRASPVTWNNEGSRISVLEGRPWHVVDGTGMAGYLLWEYELVFGRRRLVAGFPLSARLDFTQISYSCDDSWIHMCDWGYGRNFLIRVADGLVVTLPVTSTAVDWNPRNGPNAMIAMTQDSSVGRLVIHDYDLATNTLEYRSDLESPNGLPLSVRELAMSADGSLALVTAPVGVRGLDQGARGDVHIAAVIDIEEGLIEPVLPVSFRTRSAQRRHTSPRWCDERPREEHQSVAVAEHLLSSAVPGRCDDDSPELIQAILRRWTEVIEGIAAAWASGKMPPERFADEYLQHALSCHQLDERAAEHATASVRYKARTDPSARTVIRALDSYRDSGWRPATVLPRSEPCPTAERPHKPGVASLAGPSVPEDILVTCLDRLIAAESLEDAATAARALRQAVSPGPGENGPWQTLAQASGDALAQANYPLVAKLGLASVFWLKYFQPELLVTGLPQAPTSALLPILVNCFEACTHLSERMVIGADAQSIFDVEDTRNRCQRGLSQLPLADYLATTYRNPTTRSGVSRVPNPADDHPEGNSPVTIRKRVFISYVHEDAGSVDRLAAALAANGFDVWLDRTHLLPGMRWKSVIRKAIRGGDYFIACFSPRYVSKNETFMNEELNIAIERLRRMSRSHQWFFPIVLEDCEIPDYEIGPGETLDSLQYLDFSRDWDAALKKLVATLSAGTT